MNFNFNFNCHQRMLLSNILNTSLACHTHVHVWPHGREWLSGKELSCAIFTSAPPPISFVSSHSRSRLRLPSSSPARTMSKLPRTFCSVPTRWLDRGCKKRMWGLGECHFLYCCLSSSLTAPKQTYTTDAAQYEQKVVVTQCTCTFQTTDGRDGTR